MPCIKGLVSRVERESEWVKMLVDTSDQFMYTADTTDGHHKPDYTMCHVDAQWNRVGAQATLLMPLKGLTGSIMVLHDLTGSTTSHLQKQTCLSIPVCYCVWIVHKCGCYNKQ